MRDEIPETSTVSGNPRCSIPETTQKLEHRVKIFYAWQNDIDNKLNRYFIRDAIEMAIKSLNRSIEIEDSPRTIFSLDHDTKGVPGMPEIARTILEKIENSDIFLADLTYIAHTLPQNVPPKYLPNPNVIFELGYAFHALEAERIICVMNEAFGTAAELFFDMAHRRWPITYMLSSEIKDDIPQKKPC